MTTKTLDVNEKFEEKVLSAPKHVIDTDAEEGATTTECFALATTINGGDER